MLSPAIRTTCLCPAGQSLEEKVLVFHFWCLMLGVTQLSQSEEALVPEVVVWVLWQNVPYALYVAWYIDLVPIVVPLVAPNFLGAFFVCMQGVPYGGICKCQQVVQGIFHAGMYTISQSI